MLDANHPLSCPSRGVVPSRRSQSSRNTIQSPAWTSIRAVKRHALETRQQLRNVSAPQRKVSIIPPMWVELRALCEIRHESTFVSLAILASRSTFMLFI